MWYSPDIHIFLITIGSLFAISYRPPAIPGREVTNAKHKSFAGSAVLNPLISSPHPMGELVCCEAKPIALIIFNFQGSFRVHILR